MSRVLLGGLLLLLACGCKKSSSGDGGSSSTGDTSVRYTVRDIFLTRSSRNRDSVLKTVGMNEEQIRAWVKASPADEDRRVETGGDDRGGGPVVTIRNERGSLSSRNRESIPQSSRDMSDEQIRAWVEDGNGAKEGRAATLAKNGYLEIMWRGSTGELLYTVRNHLGSRTGRVRASVLSTLSMNENQVFAWVEDAAAAGEGRCATFARNEFMEGVSRGPLQDPPWGQ